MPVSRVGASAGDHGRSGGHSGRTMAGRKRGRWAQTLGWAQAAIRPTRVNSATTSMNRSMNRYSTGASTRPPRNTAMVR